MKKPGLFRYPPMRRRSPALQLRRTQCRIEDAKAALADIIGIWGDEDQHIENEAERLLQELDALMADVREAVRERTEERRAADE